MVDPEPGTYRPRRAILEPDPSEDESITSDVDGSQRTLAETAGNGSRARRASSRAMPDDAESSDFAVARETRPSYERADTQSPEIATPNSRPGAQSTSNNDDIGSDWASSRRSIFADLDDDDDVAPPLYRDSSPVAERPDGPPIRTTGLRPPEADEAEVDTGRQTWVRPALANAPRRFRPPDAEATTILPRTS